MEKQSTRKFYRLLIVVVAFCVMCVSGLMLASCKEHQHSYAATVTTAATCTTTGVETFTCSECGDTYTSVIPATGKHGTANDFGACPDCGLIIDASKFATALGTSGLQSGIDSLTSQLNTLKTEVESAIEQSAGTTNTALEGLKTDINNVMSALKGTGEGPSVAENVEDLVKNVQAVLAEIRALIGSETAATTGTPATITGIAAAIDDLKAAVDKIAETVGAQLEGIEKVCEEHVWSAEPVYTVEATCMKGGVEVYGCQNCNAVYSIAVAPVQHVASETADEELSYAATCTTAGKEVYTCVYGCGTVMSTVEIDALGHKFDDPNCVRETTTEAKCGEPGVVTITCIRCDATTTEETDALEHIWGEWKTDTEPTCTEEGVQTRECTLCGEIETDSIDAKGHVYDGGKTVWRYGTNIDFTQNTVEATEYKICDVCGHEEATQNTQKQTHIWAIDTEKTQAQSHIKLFTALEAEDLAKTGLAEEDAVWGYVNISCSEVGYVYYYCLDSNCENNPAFPIGVPIDPLAHGGEFGSEDGLWVKSTAEGDYKAPTCIEEGYQVWKCSNCDEEYTQTLKALGHQYPENPTIVKEATCTEDGLQTFTCARCQEFIEEVIEALGHSFGEPVTTYEKKDNETHKVITTKTCTRCDYKEVTEKIVKHTFTGEVDPDNVPDGYEVYERADGSCVLTDAGCDRSGFIIDLCECGYCVRDWDSYVPMLQHDYSIVESVEGSCVTAAMVTYRCARCKVTYATTITNPNGHEWQTVAAVEPTCDTAGNSAYAYCTACGAVVEWSGTGEVNKYETTYVAGLNYLTGAEAVEAWAEDAPTGHKFDKTYYLVAGGCEEAGWEIKVCSVCGVGETGALTLKANATGYVNADEIIVEGVYEVDGVKASDEMLAKLYEALNTALSLTGTAAISSIEEIEAMLTGYNFTGVKYIDKAGHDWTEKQAAKDETGVWSEGSEDATVDCMADPLLVDQTSYTAYVQALNSELTDVEIAVKWNEAYPATSTDEVKIAYVCKTCGKIFKAVDHKVEYHMYVVTDANGLTADKATAENPIDQNTAHVDTTKFVTDADGNAVSYTYEKIVEMGYVNEDGTVNCYFLGYCTYGCETNVGHSYNHTYPAPDNIDKYPNCMEGGYCVWCDEMIMAPSSHNLQDLETIAAYSDEYKAAVDALLADETLTWALADVAATCYAEGTDYTVRVCVSCLMAWYEKDSRFVGWENNLNYTSTSVVISMTPHTWLATTVGINDSGDVSNCLIGSYKYDVCYVCGLNNKTTYRLNDTVEVDEVLTYVVTDANGDVVLDENGKYTTTTVTITAENAATYNSDNNGFYDVKSPSSHTVAPEENYWLNKNYKPATATDPAYMNYICVECGAHVQGFYGEPTTVAGITLYTMATDAQINDYLATAGAATGIDKVKEWGAITYARDEDKSASTTLGADATATTVSDALAAANASGATTAYVNVTNDITFDSNFYGYTFDSANSVTTVNVDLGEKTLTLSPANAANAFSVSGKGTLVITNGTIEANTTGGGNFAMHASLGAEIVLDGVTMTSTGCLLGSGNNNDPQAALGDITIRNCELTSTGYYVISTNATASADSKFNLTIENSKLSVSNATGDSCALLFNVPGTLTIKNSTITADRQGVVLRGGLITATIENTTINVTGSGYGTLNGRLDAWGSGNEVPMGGIVLGNRTGSGYQSGATTVDLKGVIINSTNTNVPKIYAYVETGTTVTINVTNGTTGTIAYEDIVVGMGSAENGVTITGVTPATGA